MIEWLDGWTAERLLANLFVIPVAQVSVGDILFRGQLRRKWLFDAFKQQGC